MSNSNQNAFEQIADILEKVGNIIVTMDKRLGRIEERLNDLTAEITEINTVKEDEQQQLKQQQELQSAFEELTKMTEQQKSVGQQAAKAANTIKQQSTPDIWTDLFKDMTTPYWGQWKEKKEKK